MCVCQQPSRRATHGQLAARRPGQSKPQSRAALPPAAQQFAASLGRVAGPPCSDRAGRAFIAEPDARLCAAPTGKAPSSVVDRDYVVVTRSMSSLRWSCSWSVGRAADGLDGYSKHPHAALYDPLAASDETHLGLDTAQGRVELQQVIPLVNTKTE